MNAVPQLSWLQMLSIYGLLLVPFLVFLLIKAGTNKKLLISALRMSIQLSLVAIYLEWLFRLNHPALNLTWMLVMLLVSTWSTLSDTGSSFKNLGIAVFTGSALSTLPPAFILIWAAHGANSLFDARWLIPIFGMILGNTLRANLVGLERFIDGIKQNTGLFHERLMMGASLYSACAPYTAKAVKAAVMPHLATMATLGIVSLPGMMTGQILGGSSPVTAVQYQIAIFIAIVAASTLGAYLVIRFVQHAAFDEFGNLHH